jgi:hypothetical protein
MDRASAVVGCVSRPPVRSPTMTLPRSVADVLADHVVFEVECIDRLFSVLAPSVAGRGAGVALGVGPTAGMSLDRHAVGLPRGPRVQADRLVSSVARPSARA